MTGTDPQHVDGAHLPWSLKTGTTPSAIVGRILAQGDSDSIGCHIVVHGVVDPESISHEANPFTVSRLKAA